MPSLIESAARWTSHYLKHAPCALFATPAFYFSLDGTFIPNSDTIRFVTTEDLVDTPPEALLRRALNNAGVATHALVLAVVLGDSGDLFMDQIGPPEKLLLYVYVPSDKGTPVFERRILTRSSESDAFKIEPDRTVTFDGRHRLRLAQPRFRGKQAPETPPPGQTLH